MVVRGRRETSGLEGVSERLFTIQEQTASVDYLGESTEGDLLLVDAPRTGGLIDVLGLQSVGDVVDADVEKLADKTDVFFPSHSFDATSSAFDAGMLERIGN